LVSALKAFKHPVTIDVDVLSVRVFGSLRLNISETRPDSGMVPVDSL